MKRLIARLALLPATVLVVTLLTFALMHLAPGDPAEMRSGTGATPQSIAENRALLGLEKPIVERYALWLSRSLRLDFGRSLTDGRQVRTRIAEALPVTLGLAFFALLLSVLVAIPLGLIGATRASPTRASPTRRLETALSLLYGLPIPALAMLLLRAGAPWGRGVLAPALCLALPSALVLAQQERSALSSVWTSDYVRTARAKGASPTTILLSHALRNALVPVVILLGMQAPALLSGSVLVERIFGLPGIGLLGYESVLGRDYPMLMALTTLAALLAVSLVLCADLALWLLDPRLRTSDPVAGSATATATTTVT